MVKSCAWDKLHVMPRVRVSIDSNNIDNLIIQRKIGNSNLWTITAEYLFSHIKDIICIDSYCLLHCWLLLWQIAYIFSICIYIPSVHSFFLYNMFMLTFLKKQVRGITHSVSAWRWVGDGFDARAKPRHS